MRIKKLQLKIEQLEITLNEEKKQILKQEIYIKHIRDHYKRAKEIIKSYQDGLTDILKIPDSECWQFAATNAMQFFIRSKIHKLQNELTKIKAENKRLRE